MWKVPGEKVLWYTEVWIRISTGKNVWICTVDEWKGRNKRAGVKLHKCDSCFKRMQFVLSIVFLFFFWRNYSTLVIYMSHFTWHLFTTLTFFKLHQFVSNVAAMQKKKSQIVCFSFTKRVIRSSNLTETALMWTNIAIRCVFKLETVTMKQNPSTTYFFLKACPVDEYAI